SNGLVVGLCERGPHEKRTAVGYAVATPIGWIVSDAGNACTTDPHGKINDVGVLDPDGRHIGAGVHSNPIPSRLRHVGPTSEAPYTGVILRNPFHLGVVNGWFGVAVRVEAVYRRAVGAGGLKAEMVVSAERSVPTDH